MGAARRPFRPTWATVSLSAFAANVRALRSLAAPARLMAVLKADAYGHGADALAPVALDNGADLIGVSSIEEGISLRAGGIKAPILLLGSVYPLDNFPAVLDAGLTPSVSSLDAAQQLAIAASAAGRVADFHLKVDTGMGRLGASPSGARAVLQWAASQSALRLAGVYTHFAAADSDATFTRRQLQELDGLKAVVRSTGFSNVMFHAAGSSGLLGHPDSRLDLVRPGIALFGAPLVALPAGVSLKPVLSWRSSIVFQKRVSAGTTISYGRTWSAPAEAEIATIPVGYADGVPRAVAGKASVLIKGRRRPVVGTITMDHIMVDVTGAGSTVGDDVVLIGEQEGECLSVEDWAGWANTISYEIFTGISKRVPRVVTE